MFIMKNILSIVNGDVTVLVDSVDNMGSFAFYGVTVANKPGVIYKRYLHTNDQNSASKTFIGMDKYVFGKMRDLADVELKAYITEHIGDTDFYTAKTEYGEPAFFTRSCNFRNEYPEAEKDGECTYSKIEQGLVDCKIGGIYTVFDLVQDKFVSIKKGYGRDTDEDVTPLQVLYGTSGSKLNLIIALEQYKLGKAHPAFTEIINLNTWLDGKKSVKFHMVSGKVHELKSGRVCASQILDCVDDVFYLTDNYNLKPRLNTAYDAPRTEVSELDHLQFGNKVYKLVNSNLAI